MRRGAALLVLLAGLAVPSSATAGASRTGTVAVYGGVGSWVDIFATAARAEPRTVVAQLKLHGVRTLYLQTSNYSQPTAVVDPRVVGAFLDDAHAVGIHVVAWYLPSLAQPTLDRRRALAMLRFRSPRGARFDSVALDIESDVEKNVALRNVRLVALAHALRAAAPAGYPLGAIVPSPVGMRRHPHYWPGFPYRQLAPSFDVFLPMAYFSYYEKTPRGVAAYTTQVVRAIRRETGRPDVLVHAIGGIADALTPAEVSAFAQASERCGVVGLSLYAYLETAASAWTTLAAAHLGRAPVSACA